MHSDDFYEYGEIIDGKTKEEWEKEFGIKESIYSLHKLGWERYQWNIESEEDIQEDEYYTHFAEFFSPYYNGYLRGDSRTSLKEATEQCLGIAQRYATCENRTGHEYITKTNSSYASCKHCGFDGFSTGIQKLQSKIQYLKSQLKCERKRNQKILENAKKEGIIFNALYKVIKK